VNEFHHDRDGPGDVISPLNPNLDQSGLPEYSLIKIGWDHRQGHVEPLEALWLAKTGNEARKWLSCRMLNMFTVRIVYLLLFARPHHPRFRSRRKIT
jgi:hypothetical protein